MSSSLQQNFLTTRHPYHVVTGIGAELPTCVSELSSPSLTVAVGLVGGGLV